MSWEYVTLDKLGAVSRGRSKHRPRNDASLFGGDYPFIQTTDVKDAPFYITSYSDTYNEKGLSQSKLWNKGTLCITIAANIADTAILGIDACFPDSVMGFIPHKGISDVRFVKYAFDMLQRDMRQISQGTAQDNLSWQKLSTIKFPKPPIGIQERIADVLTAYEDLIENNRKQIQLLEEAAQRLYKEWFVDLHFPGYKAVPIVGDIPNGWEEVCLDETLEKITTGLNPRKNFTLGKGENYYVTIKNMGNNDVFLDEKCDRVDDEAIVKINNRSDLRTGDFLFSGIGTMGRVYWICIPTNNWNVSESVFTMRANNRITKEYLYMVLLSADMQNYCDQNAHGAAQRGIRMADLRAFRFLLPSKDILDRFTDVSSPLIRKAQVLREESKKISEARDRLLPKLMSGEIEL